MPARKLNAPLGASLVVISSFFYASYGIWTTLMGNFFGGYTASALRSILVLIILIPLAIVYRRLEPLNLRANWRYFAGMVVASMLVWGPLYYAILKQGIGITSAVNYTSIVLGMFIFGWIFSKERFTKDIMDIITAWRYGSNSDIYTQRIEFRLATLRGGRHPLY